GGGGWWGGGGGRGGARRPGGAGPPPPFLVVVSQPRLQAPGGALKDLSGRGADRGHGRETRTGDGSSPRYHSDQARALPDRPTRHSLRFSTRDDGPAAGSLRPRRRIPAVATYGQFTVNLQASFRTPRPKSELLCRHDRTTTTNQGFSRAGKTCHADHAFPKGSNPDAHPFSR